ncbi:MAG: flagellar basal body P-ring protein FlgI [Bacillota bacterium]|nr:flagellar basal body P-ring protein FlgI [Bacillota bacterium]
MCRRKRLAILMLWVLALGGLLGAAAQAAPADDPAVRIKDIARILGDRPNQLTGLGLVTGLEGTGDSSTSLANVQMVANMLRNFGVTVPPERLRVRNVAAVTVTAELPPFARNGDRIDVLVSSLGDAKSLQGGVLLLTPLRGADGRVYAVAQGPVSIGGFNVRRGGAAVEKNHPTVGIVPGGATVEVEVPAELATQDRVTLVLREPDFTTAARVAEVINRTFTPQTARAVDKSTVEVVLPAAYREEPVSFIAALEELPVRPDGVARIVVNERTGTIVVGHQVRLSTVAVAQGNLSVRIVSRPEVSQPPPFSGGETVVTPGAEITAEEGQGHMVVLPSPVAVQDLVDALNGVGATPRDIIAILQAIKAAGALHGELIIQ